MNAAPSSGRLVFITGASSGIGRALALQYYRDGARLALLARRGDALYGWARAEGWDAQRYAVYAVDVQDGAALASAAAQCLATQGVPDIVIANAGVSIGIDPSQADDLRMLELTLRTNVLGLAASFQPFLQAMQQRRSGTLVGIASVASLRGLPGHAAYCASKAAVVAYCESLRVECRAYDVRVVTIAPGYIDTPLTQQNRYRMPFLMPPERFAQLAVRSIAQGTSWRVIPWQMGLIGRVLKLLPNAVYDRLAQRMPRKHRGTPRPPQA